MCIHAYIFFGEYFDMYALKFICIQHTCTAVLFSRNTYARVGAVAPQCNILQHTVTPTASPSATQETVRCHSMWMLQQILTPATNCNLLQPTLAHRGQQDAPRCSCCSALLHTATRCNSLKLFLQRREI